MGSRQPTGQWPAWAGSNGSDRATDWHGSARQTDAALAVRERTETVYTVKMVP